MKYVRILLIVAIGFLHVTFVQALDASNVTSSAVAVLGPNEAELNANINFGVDTQVDFWFEYGTSSSGIIFETEKVTWDVRGYYNTYKRIGDLMPDTTYYYVGVVSVDGSVSRTDVKTFKTFTDFSLENPDEENAFGDTYHSGLVNPFDYFRQDKDDDIESDIPVEDEEQTSESVEYKDEPVGGIVNDDSVYYTDDDGDIIEYSDEYRNRFNQKKKGSSNVGVYFVVILIFLLILFVVYRKRFSKNGRFTSRNNPRLARLNKYRHPHEKPMQNNQRPAGNRTFFRRPPKK